MALNASRISLCGTFASTGRVSILMRPPDFSLTVSAKRSNAFWFAKEFVRFLVREGWLAHYLDFAGDRMLPPLPNQPRAGGRRGDRPGQADP